MTKKIIKQILKSKIKKWADSVTDEKIKKIILTKTIITGGCITSMLLKEKVKDFDVYLVDKESVLAIAKYYVDIFKQNHNQSIEILNGKDAGIEEGTKWANMTEDRVKIFIPSKGAVSENNEEIPDTEDLLERGEEIPEDLVEDKKENEKDRVKYRPVYLTANAITLSDKIQIVIRFYGNPEKIHENYDFVHCMNYYLTSENKLIFNSQALESIITKQLKYIGSKYPVCSIMRMRKFIERGWHINAGNILKMVFQVSQLELEKLDTLEDQLVGVDSSYFSQLIDALRSETSEIVEQNYLCSIIDKIFG